MIIKGWKETGEQGQILCVIYSPSPYFCEIGDLRIGPNCLGSPASTS